MSETIYSVRQGWYALPDAATDVVSAVRVGGWLTSVSVSGRYSLWALHDGLLHVAVAPNASRLRSHTTVARRLTRTRTAYVCIGDDLELLHT